MRIVAVLLCCCLLLSVGCKKQEQEKEKTVGRYLYVATYGVVHANRECNRIRASVDFVDTADFDGRYVNNVGDIVEYTYCSRCVTDNMYDEIRRIVGKGKTSALRELYNSLIRDGYVMEEVDFEDFRDCLEDEEYRNFVYDALLDDDSANYRR